MPLATVNQLEESQSHRTDQGSSDANSSQRLTDKIFQSRNPTVQIRALPTVSVSSRWRPSLKRRNPTIQIRAVLTVEAGYLVGRLQKSQSTVQINAVPTR